MRRLRQHADVRLHFEQDQSSAHRLGQLREYLRLENEMMVRYHRKGDSGRRVCLARSLVMDVLIERLFEDVLAGRGSNAENEAEPVCLVALGGYGRCELSPFSDIDLMFLYRRNARNAEVKGLQQAMTDGILYPLWDLRLKVGHSSRTVREALEEARKEVQTKNALLEARLICGSKKLFHKFQKDFSALLEKEDIPAYVAARLEDQQARREKYGGTVFMQEPDIKNGVGGLRDYQNIVWMALMRMGTGRFEELVKKRYLGKNEQAQLETAYDFLLRVRNELHFESSRATDLLDLEKQPSVAYQLGYRQGDLFKRVEAFMRDYYSHARHIHQISRVLEQRLALTGLPGRGTVTFKAALESRRHTQRKQFDGFVLSDGELAARDARTFKEDPVRLLRVFRHRQQYEAAFSLDLIAQIKDSLPLLTPMVRADSHAARAFLAILRQPGEVFDTLERMHEFGVLGRFLPEFGDLTCLVQHEYYHRYTADYHTLRTIRVLDEILAGEGGHPTAYARVLRETESPWMLYLMLLVHDLGKAHGAQDHPETGGRICEPILKRLGLDADARRLVLFMVRYHLEMARFWQRHDLDDPRTARAFADVVGDAERLRYLYVLTYCDARGTSADLWNSYKDTLHNSLYERTLKLLSTGADPAAEHKEKRQMLYREFLQKDIAGISREEIEAHFTLLPERYFLHCGADEVELHLRMVHQLLTHISEADSVGSLVPIIDWSDDLDQGMTVINVVTWDRAGLFYKLAGALTVAGLNILSTKAISRTDHITIDTFYVIDPGGGPVENPKAREVFEEHVREALLRNRDLLPAINEQAHRLERPAYMRRNDRLRAPIPPTVDVYHELSLRRTIIEVTANDHIGLLYRLAKTIFDYGYDITFARISTERSVALDTFYIEKVAPDEHYGGNGTGKAGEATNLIALRQALNKVVAEENTAVYATG